MSAGGSVGMIPDRALNLDLLDVSLRIATLYSDDRQARPMLAVALRDHVTPKEAENKTKKVLSRIWVSPRDEARPMIRWGVEHQGGAGDRRALHYGALLAAFPFFGSVAAIVGRQLHLEGVADRRIVRTESRAIFGEREFIDAATSKSLATMRNLELIDGPTSGPFGIGSRPRLHGEFVGWALHALLLSRQVQTVGVETAPRSPELSFLTLEGSASGYPLLAIHNETNRTIAEER